jgi:hypothetical protein
MARKRESLASPVALRAPSEASEARPERGRFSAKRKMATVIRLLRGEDLDGLSRELRVTAATPSWATRGGSPTSNMRAAEWSLKRSWRNSFGNESWDPGKRDVNAQAEGRLRAATEARREALERWMALR